MPQAQEASQASLKLRKNDLYETPPIAVEALLRAEYINEPVWEPACGPGAIVQVLRSDGVLTFGSDLVDYKSPYQDAHGWDFLMESKMPQDTGIIITNPPFKLAMPFIEKALELSPRVMMLLRLSFYEGKGKRRCAILDGGRLRRVHVFRARLPRMHRDDWEGNMAAPRLAFGWYVWEREIGPTIMDRI